ncbi:MAG TPA: DUF2339 domain-containing protein, partial [Chitinophagaceae bacterium]|nr:DUF2339 domain-containing protein [Chitinophagaceae bacterium]
MDLQEKIDQLSKQLNELARQQTGISKQILQLMEELEKLKREASAEQTQIPAAPPKVIEFEKVITVPAAPPPAPVQQPIASKKKKRSTLEEFIGGNLTSKAGILITIIGIFIGSKYAIEHNLVNPVIRVIMGYTNGLILAGIAIRLKKKYENYSAVLMG